MSEKFALRVWEGGEEWRGEYDVAQKRFSEIRKRLGEREFICTYLGGLRLDKNCVPEVWLNDNMPLCPDRYCKTPEDALHYALKHGTCAWWNLDELSDFADGKGIILEEAMRKIGFRRHKRNPELWARLRGDEKGKTSERRMNRWKEQHSKQYIEIDDEERKRMGGLIAMPNKSAGIGRTYNIEANTRGMIYVELWANPFVGTTAETLWMLGDQINNRGHIHKQQNGFSMEARNVVLYSDPNLVMPNGVAADCVYIQAKRDDGREIETVWPGVIPNEKLYDLANDLVGKVLDGKE